MRVIELAPGESLSDPLVEAEVYAPEIARFSAQAGSAPTDIEGIPVDLGVETRHVIIHDVHNIGWWAWRPGIKQDALLYDVTIYNVGWHSSDDPGRPDGGHGQALYTQNYADGGSRLIDTCVFIAGFSLPGKIYGTNGEISRSGWVLASIPNGREFNVYGRPDDPETPKPWDFTSPRNKLANYTIRRSIFIGTRFIVGNEGQAPWGAHNIDLDECLFHAWFQFGYDGYNGDGRLRNSLLLSGVSIQCPVPEVGQAVPNITDDGQPLGPPTSWRSLEVTGNTFVVPARAAINVVYPQPGWVWDHNVYWSEVEKPFQVTLFRGFARLPDGYPTAIIERQNLSFDEWRAVTGFDANSTFHLGLPPEPLRREYVVPELGERVVAQWDVKGAAVPSGATALYPPPDPLGWPGPAPAINPLDGRLRVWREPAAQAAIDDEALQVAALQAALALSWSNLQTQQERIQELESEQATLLAGWQQETAEREALHRTVERDRPLVEAARALWAASAAFGQAVEEQPHP
ncbi:MAG: hypothetical protein IPK19_19350 [Chloroflexi bacterium]|nr:hypothetical protein [Chloroflexota bacterium]